MKEEDLAAADRVRRLAFGTLTGLPDPLKYAEDADLVRRRWLADPSAGFVAEMAGEVVGSNFAVNRGSIGFFGPLSVRPDLWNRGIAQRLLEPVMQIYEKWGVRHAGVFVSITNPKNLALYQKFGFWPRFPTPIMFKRVESSGPRSPWLRYSQVPTDERRKCLDECYRLTDANYSGLDLRREIETADTHRFGDTLMLYTGGELESFALCYHETFPKPRGSVCYIKFGAIRDGRDKATAFDRLLNACQEYAVLQGASQLMAGISTECRLAYSQMLARGFRMNRAGVTMHRPDEHGYLHPETYVIDDWR